VKELPVDTKPLTEQTQTVQSEKSEDKKP